MVGANALRDSDFIILSLPACCRALACALSRERARARRHFLGTPGNELDTEFTLQGAQQPSCIAADFIQAGRPFRREDRAVVGSRRYAVSKEGYTV